jgi:hypothetical protein
VQLDAQRDAAVPDAGAHALGDVRGAAHGGRAVRSVMVCLDVPGLVGRDGAG